MLLQSPSEIVYPSSDGKPMADNTLQFRWIVTIEGGLETVFRDQNVFVAGDLLWHPVEGNTKISAAPDVMVALGRPKGDRLSYKQWEEENVAPQVVFEILSLNNSVMEMEEKRDFYEEYGVQEYYLYDPYNIKLLGWRRVGETLRKIRQMQGWVSLLLKIRFEIDGELVIYGPDGARFLSYAQLGEERERQQARAEQEKERAEGAERRYEQLLAHLRDQGIDPEAGSPPKSS
jgi:Uma2 family endonuclease